MKWLKGLFGFIIVIPGSVLIAGSFYAISVEMIRGTEPPFKEWALAGVFIIGCLILFMAGLNALVSFLDDIL